MGIIARLDVGRIRGTEVDCTWIKRSSPRDGSKTGVIMSLPHGYLPTTYFAVPADDEARACAQQGFPVASPDGGTTTFGNDDAIDSVEDAWTFLKTKFGCRTDKVFLLGMSMGALDVLNWARQNLASVAGIALVTPAIDLAEVRLVNGTYTTEVDAAYGGSAAVTAALPTHSPVVYASELLGIPINYWYSTNDTMTPLSESFVSASLANAISMGAIGHNPSGALGSDIATWFQTIL